MFIINMFNLIGVDFISKLLGNVSLPGCGSFTREKVTGEKENSMLFTCCLHKESLAGDKNRFQTLSTPVCAWNFSVLRAQVHMQTRVHTHFTAGTHIVTAREHKTVPPYGHRQKKKLFTLKVKWQKQCKSSNEHLTEHTLTDSPLQTNKKKIRSY